MTTIPKKRHGRPSKRPSAEELSMLYSGMTAPEIAEHYKVSESTVRAWLGYYRKQAERS